MEFIDAPKEIQNMINNSLDVKQKIQIIEKDLVQAIQQTQSWQIKALKLDAQIQILKELLKEGETNGVAQEVKESN